jgi:DNA-directed RNA polymerase subunit RPC12/RpoP
MLRLLPRLVALITLALAGYALARWVAKQSQGRDSAAREKHAFRPRANKQSAAYRRTGDGDVSDAVYVMPRASTEGVCDALTGSAVNTAAPVWRCVHCQSLYNSASLEAMKQDQTACVQCGSAGNAFADANFIKVTFTDD